MKNPNPVNLQSSAEVRERGWQAESRDADGHLISCHAPIEADDPGIAEWIVECTSRGETVTFWPTNGEVAATQPPPPSSHVAPQFLPTEDGEFIGNVGELIVPAHCSGYSFSFDPGVLHVNKDGSGYIAVNEEDFILEDDRDCEGGSIHWIARIDASEITALRDFLNGTPQQQENAMTEDQIKHMVNRFLGWKLPDNFNPDGGVSFTKTFNEHTDHPMKHEPSGTNLLDASQAETMIRYLLEGLPPQPNVEATQPVAYRWRWTDSEAWVLTRDKPDHVARVVEPLFTAPAPVDHVAATEAAKRYLAAIDSDPENDIWDTWDGKPAEGALKTASDASWAEHGQKIEARLSELRAAIATTEGSADE